MSVRSLLSIQIDITQQIYYYKLRVFLFRGSENFLGSGGCYNYNKNSIWKRGFFMFKNMVYADLIYGTFI